MAFPAKRDIDLIIVPLRTKYVIKDFNVQHCRKQIAENKIQFFFLFNFP